MGKRYSLKKKPRNAREAKKQCKNIADAIEFKSYTCDVLDNHRDDIVQGKIPEGLTTAPTAKDYFDAYKTMFASSLKGLAAGGAIRVVGIVSTKAIEHMASNSEVYDSLPKPLQIAMHGMGYAGVFLPEILTVAVSGVHKIGTIGAYPDEEVLDIAKKLKKISKKGASPKQVGQMFDSIQAYNKGDVVAHLEQLIEIKKKWGLKGVAAHQTQLEKLKKELGG